MPFTSLPFLLLRKNQFPLIQGEPKRDQQKHSVYYNVKAMEATFKRAASDRMVVFGFSTVREVSWVHGASCIHSTANV